MRFSAKYLLRSACFSGLCLFGLVFTGCSGSDDPVEQPGPPVNVAPVAVNDAFTVLQGSTTPLTLAANDTDADDGLNLASIAIIATPANGAVIINADGSVNYSHDGSDTVSDLFTYTIKDNSGAASNIANVTITVTPPLPPPVNAAPVAVNDNFTVVKGSATPLNLAGNDTDADDGLNLASIVIVAAPANGGVSVNADGSVDYTHNDSATVSDLFTYNIKDNSGAVSNTANVAITVTPPVPLSVHAGIYDVTAVEGADDLEFVVSLSSASSETVTVDYATANGTALAGTDYSAKNGTVQFTPGELRKFVTVAVINNTAAPTTTSKSMLLVLSNPQNVLLGDDSATGTIIDKDKVLTDTAFTAGWGQVGAFTNAVDCNDACHVSSGSVMTSDGKDISPGKQWKHSVMANAFIDPYWQAAVEDEVDSFPDLTGLIEDTCTTCHAPMGRTYAYHTNTNLTDGYFRFDTAKSEDISREGVSCTLCHQIGAGNLGTLESFSGGFAIQGDPVAADYKDIYGPYNNPSTGRMDNSTGHKPVGDPYITKSELCATCHTLYTPALDPDTGIPSGTSFLEQGTYLEWLNSVYATAGAQEAQCQSCHMPEPEAGYETKISTPPPNNLSTRSPYGQHTLAGGNAHLLEILRDYRSDLGIAGSTTVSGFDEQIALTQSFLGSAASVTVSTPVAADGRLNFDIEVVNNAGHRLPSGYPSRRMWLHVLVKNADDIIFESGKPDIRGYISTDDNRLKADCMSAHKLEGFDSTLCYEPHRDVIDDPSQVAIYEPVLGDVHGNITHTLLQAERYLKDNRIPPTGFTNSKAATIEAQTIPAGVAGDSDFNCISTSEGCGADTVHYQVNIEGQSGPYTVETRLLYQATQPGFVDGMHNVGDRVNRFKVMYDAVPPSVEVLATVIKSM